jgi:hypothetical protein
MTKVQSASLHFFLGSEDMEESDSEDEVRYLFPDIFDDLRAISRLTSELYITDAKSIRKRGAVIRNSESS